MQFPPLSSIALGLFFLSVAFDGANCQTSADMAINLRVAWQANPAGVRLTWTPRAGATGHIVRAKARVATGWTVIDTLSATDSVYLDTSATMGSAKEYYVLQQGPVVAYQYAFAGFEWRPTHALGDLALILDSTYVQILQLEIGQLEADLWASGYTVHKRIFSRSAVPSQIRTALQELRDTVPKLIGAYIVGHVAVPYSGDMNPDGHPDHRGAWPADVYYAELDANWADFVVNSTTASRPENHNTPGDGKFDFSSLQNANSRADIYVGRADFFDLPAMPMTDTVMLQAYLNRAHDFRMGLLAYPRRGLVEDNFGYFGGEAFAQNGYRNFNAFFGPDSVFTMDYDSLRTKAFLCSYGTGPGTYTSVGGVVGTSDFAASSYQPGFMMLFGSYHGDWDSQDNVLRAGLSHGLGIAWAGRPNWFLHGMALGETAGDAYLNSVNNGTIGPWPGLYAPGGFSRTGAHMAWLGDPSLKLHHLAPAQNLTAAAFPDSVALHWTASPDAQAGYLVLRAPRPDSPFVPISDAFVQGTSFFDTSQVAGPQWYRVCAVKLEATGSGTYFNYSLGITDSVWAIADTSPGTVGIAQTALLWAAPHPNPSTGPLTVRWPSNDFRGGSFFMTDCLGKKVFASPVEAINQRFDLHHLAPGTYVLHYQNQDNKWCQKWVKLP